ncbi:MAG TPA: squalene cyclase [Actinomycetales bacterium]|nr:squalene cyclase [Actinomycetales bacterium]
MDDVTTWLLDSDPALRWQVLQDLTDAPADEVVRERSRIAETGWGKQLLDLQKNGQWAGGACFPNGDWRLAHAEPGSQPWTATLPTLRLLRHFGIEPDDPRVRAAMAGVREHCRWEYDDLPFFGGEVEPCINGGTVAVGAYFGQDVDGVVTRLLGEQLEDGGWNCEAENGSTRSSFHTTICVLDGLLEYERAGGAVPVADSRRSAEEYLLTRHLFRRASTGEIADPAWLQFSFPPQWHYDVLHGLDYFRSSSGTPDPRLDEAVDRLRHKQQSDGSWLLENTHPGAMHFSLEGGDGRPSRWNTLRALRVLRWYDGDAA